MNKQDVPTNDSTTPSGLDFSFEVFPPRTEAGLSPLARTASELASVPPAFISVTFGAGGGRTDNSLAAVDAVAESDVPIAAHLTCVGQPVDQVNATIDQFARRGVTRIVALRGDPPDGVDAEYSPHPEGYQHTADLVAAIKARGNFWVAVSAYPEVHPQSRDLDHDLDVLEAKVAAGADAAMTQMFFDNGYFFAYLEAARDRGITVPIIPGIFPIHDFDAVHRFATSCGAAIPDSLAARFTPTSDGANDDPHDANVGFDIAVDVAASQISDLAANGVSQVHLYTLNRPELALAVVAEVRRRIAPADHGR